MRQNVTKILEVRNITNHYAGQPLLQDVSFSLDKGEILCLLGPSGSGKTTLLRLLAGLEREESGTIFFCGRDVKPIAPHKRKIGMMFQEYALFPHKSVHQNIAFGLEMQKCSPAEQEKRIQSMLELVGMSGFDHRKIDELSGGERQRVALARSLAPEPKLLLLDEPLGSLDRTLRDRLTGEIRSILKTLGVTAVFVTHDQAEAFTVADKVAVLHSGILQQFDTPENLYRTPANTTVARFLGFSNFIQGEVDDAGVFQLCGEGVSGINLKPKGDVKDRLMTLLLRPEGATLSESAAAPTGGPQLSGIVRNCRFQGSTYSLTLTVQEAVFTFDLPIDPVPPGGGQPVCLALNPSSLILLADEGLSLPQKRQ